MEQSAENAKILFLAGHYHQCGGVTSMLTLIRILREQGLDVRLITGMRGNAVEVEGEYGVRSDCIRSYNWTKPLRRCTVLEAAKIAVKRMYNFFCAERKLRYALRDYKPDCVVINSSDQYVGIRSCHRMGIPVVMHFREFMTSDHGKCYWSERMARRYFAKLSGGIAISQDIRDYFSRYPIPQLAVIYNGVDVGRYEAQGAERSTEEFRIACVGRLSDGKNQMLALRAAVRLRESGKEKFRFLFYGDDGSDYAQEMKAYVAAHCLEAYVTFAGVVQDMGPCYAAAHCDLLCSRREAFGRVIVEGMLNRCLCVVADAGGAREVVADHENGLLFESDSEEALCRVLTEAMDHYSDLDFVREQGYRDAAEKYSAESNARQVADYLRKIGKREAV